MPEQGGNLASENGGAKIGIYMKAGKRAWSEERGAGSKGQDGYSGKEQVFI